MTDKIIHSKIIICWGNIVTNFKVDYFIYGPRMILQIPKWPLADDIICAHCTTCYILHTVLHTGHCAVHYTLCFTQHTVHCIAQCTLCCTLYTARHNVHYGAHCTLHTVLHTVWLLLCNVYEFLFLFHAQETIFMLKSSRDTVC